MAPIFRAPPRPPFSFASLVATDTASYDVLLTNAGGTGVSAALPTLISGKPADSTP